MSEIPFEHHQSAHCESGVASNLLLHHGLKLSEPMCFGIGSGLFFAHIPFLKVNGIPGTAYRIVPSLIFKRLCNRLNIQMHRQSFSSEAKAMTELDRVLDRGMPVGLLTSVFYLPYLPAPLRFHFNAHNLVVFGKKGNQYLVSDPVMDTTTEIDAKDLQRARFAKGALAPSGKMYYPVSVPKEVDLRKPIIDGLKKTAKDMTTIPVPMFGVKGEVFLAKRIAKYPEKLDKRKAAAYLGNIVRMQEEIGTGGAGFRFMFSAFLQEASEKIQQPVLKDFSNEMTSIGDLWREFAFSAGRICKDRPNDKDSYQGISQMLIHIADREMDFFKRLYKLPL